MPGPEPAFLHFAQETLTLREQRQGLIAANIANADTPGYKAVDIDFRAALTSAFAGGPAKAPEKFLSGYPVGLNGNDVSPTVEKLESTRNIGAMNDEVTYLRQQSLNLMTALRPNPNGI